ncbi:MAG: Hsp20/alpha crystallin family protein [Chloroflexota bacterium]
MTNLIRWEPFREMLSMRDWMDRFFEDVFARVERPLGLLGVPSVDMYQTDDDVIVKATLPGVKADDINISITGDVLHIRGEVKEEQVKEGASYHLRERRYGAFSRGLPLPTGVVADKAKAEFENGVLTLTLPKAEEVKPKMITVKAK